MSWFIVSHTTFTAFTNFHFNTNHFEPFHGHITQSIHNKNKRKRACSEHTDLIYLAYYDYEVIFQMGYKNLLGCYDKRVKSFLTM